MRDEDGEPTPALWHELAARLADADFFAALWETDPLEVKRLWAALQENSSHCVIDVYAPALERPDAAMAFGSGLPELLAYHGHAEQARVLLRYRVERARALGEPRQLQAALGELVRSGSLRSPLTELAERERICRQIGDSDALQDVLCQRAVVRWFDSLDPDDDEHGEAEARALLQEQRRICYDTGNLHGLQRWMGAKAWMLWAEGCPNPVLRLLRGQERICREIVELDDLAECLAAQAHFFIHDSNDPAAARPLLEEAEAICRDLGHIGLLEGVLGMHGILALLLSDEGLALSFLREQSELRGRLGWPSRLSRDIKFRLGAAKSGTPEVTASVVAAAEWVARALEDMSAVQAALGLRAEALIGVDQRRALALTEERERICRDLGDSDDLGDALGQRAHTLAEGEDFESAYAILRQQEAVYAGEEARSWRVRPVQGHQRDMLNAALRRSGDYDSALALCGELELVYKALGDRAGVRRILDRRTRILRRLGLGPRLSEAQDPAQLSFDF